LQGYISQAKGVVQKIIDEWKKPTFWRNILWTKAGYGGDRIDGWIQDLFNQRAYWNSHLSQVEATELFTNKTYITVTGLLSSRLEDGYMIPNFERIICEKNVPDDEEIKIENQEFYEYDRFLSMSDYDKENLMDYKTDDKSPKSNPGLNKDYKKSNKRNLIKFDKKYKFIETKSSPKNSKKK
jgi:hypothetical protein